MEVKANKIEIKDVDEWKVFIDAKLKSTNQRNQQNLPNLL